jgi:hypothetical protein
MSELICPFCFATFQDGVLDADLPICRECNPAGRMIEAEPLDEFLKKYSKIDLEGVRISWEERKDMWQVERTRILANLNKILLEYYP